MAIVHRAEVDLKAWVVWMALIESEVTGDMTVLPEQDDFRAGLNLG